MSINNESRGGGTYTTRGLSSFQKAAEENKKSNSNSFDPKKNRFSLEKGEVRDIVILDEFKSTEDFDKMGTGLFNIFEHRILDTVAKKYIYETCINDTSHCSLCDKYDGANKQIHDHYPVAFMSVLDLKGYTKKDGTVVAPVKKLLPIKPSNLENLMTFLAMSIEEDGTTRGVMLRMKRGNETTSAKIGEVIPIGKNSYKILNEDELTKTYGHSEEVGKDGRVWKKANEDLLVFDYETIFKPKTSEELAKIHGSSSSAAYSEAKEQEEVKATPKNSQVSNMANSGDSEDEEYIPWANK